MNLRFWKWALPLVAFASCKKNDSTPTETVKPTAGVYALSEGFYNGNNTVLSYYDFGSGAVSGNVFKAANNSELGDTGNDLIIYGSKMYICMTGSGNVTVVEAGTAKLIKKIDFKNGTVNKQPRRMATANGKLYVTSFDGTVSVIDTATLAITKSITVGANPEGMLVVGNSLYVANSGGLSLVPDSTVSIVDLTAEAEVKKIVVGPNPVTLAVNSLGDIYVSNYGIYQQVQPRVYVVDSKTNTVKTRLDSTLTYSQVRIFNDVAYLYSTYGATAGGAKLVDTRTNAVIRDKFVTDSTIITNTYGINIDDSNGDVYITDAKDFTTSGQVYCFDKNGKKKFSFSVAPGVNPNTVVFLRK